MNVKEECSKQMEEENTQDRRIGRAYATREGLMEESIGVVEAAESRGGQCPRQRCQNTTNKEGTNL